MCACRSTATIQKLIRKTRSDKNKKHDRPEERLQVECAAWLRERQIRFQANMTGHGLSYRHVHARTHAHISALMSAHVHA